VWFLYVLLVLYVWLLAIEKDCTLQIAQLSSLIIYPYVYLGTVCVQYRRYTIDSSTYKVKYFSVQGKQPVHIIVENGNPL